MAAGGSETRYLPERQDRPDHGDDHDGNSSAGNPQVQAEAVAFP